ncbi:hypothetical protein [Haloparvum sp. PAK95]|uniref:hypothetical protein n=1 Tax=Haloparvum sp. PAK95 TaxID=3418962 RepID=UPI003D2F0286
MNLFEAFKTDLRAFVEERKNQDAYAACEAESWYEGIDDADVIRQTDDEKEFINVRSVENEALAEDVEMDLKAAMGKVESIIDKSESEEINSN